MKKYYYAQIKGYLPVMGESPVDWYPMMKKFIDGVETDHEGNKVRRGYVFAQSELEATEKVRKMTW